MSVQRVRDFLRKYAPYLVVTETEKSTASVSEAASAFGVTEGQIAKTLSFRVGSEVVLLVMAGDRRIDNRKYKSHFGVKARMLPAEDVQELTGFAPGGVCPFGTHPSVKIYCDESLRAYKEVVPAGGNDRSGVWVEPGHLATLIGAVWVNVSLEPES